MLNLVLVAAGAGEEDDGVQEGGHGGARRVHIQVHQGTGTDTRVYGIQSPNRGEILI